MPDSFDLGLSYPPADPAPDPPPPTPEPEGPNVAAMAEEAYGSKIAHCTPQHTQEIKQRYGSDERLPVLEEFLNQRLRSGRICNDPTRTLAEEILWFVDRIGP